MLGHRFRVAQGITGALVALPCAAIGFRVVQYSFLEGFSPARVFVAVVAVVICLGLFLGSRWAFLLAAAVALLLLFAVPFSMFNPFAVGDYLASGRSPPTIMGSLPWLLPFE